MYNVKRHERTVRNTPCFEVCAELLDEALHRPCSCITKCTDRIPLDVAGNTVEEIDVVDTLLRQL